MIDGKLEMKIISDQGETQLLSVSGNVNESVKLTGAIPAGHRKQLVISYEPISNKATGQLSLAINEILFF